MGLELKDDKLERTGLPEAALNALGIPAPNRTDFKSWSRENLEAFARQAADENLVLRADNKALHEAWREVLVESVRYTFNPGLCAGAQEDLLSHP